MTADSGTLRTSSGGGDVWRARYLAGSAFSLGGHAPQQFHTFSPSTSTRMGSPIDPSLAPVTGQVFCSSTERLSRRTAVPEARAEAIRALNMGISDTGVFRVTVANMPG